jgi:thiamine kinase-like enzyme
MLGQPHAVCAYDQALKTARWLLLRFSARQGYLMMGYGLGGFLGLQPNIPPANALGHGPFGVARGAASTGPGNEAAADQISARTALPDDFCWAEDLAPRVCGPAHPSQVKAAAMAVSAEDYLALCQRLAASSSSEVSRSHADAVPPGFYPSDTSDDPAQFHMGRAHAALQAMGLSAQRVTVEPIRPGGGVPACQVAKVTHEGQAFLLKALVDPQAAHLNTFSREIDANLWVAKHSSGALVHRSSRQAGAMLSAWVAAKRLSFEPTPAQATAQNPRPTRRLFDAEGADGAPTSDRLEQLLQSLLKLHSLDARSMPRSAKGEAWIERSRYAPAALKSAAAGQYSDSDIAALMKLDKWLIQQIEVMQAATRTTSMPYQDVPLHNDFYLNNVLFPQNGDAPVLIDLADLSQGDFLFDLAHCCGIHGLSHDDFQAILALYWKNRPDSADGELPASVRERGTLWLSWMRLRLLVALIVDEGNPPALVQFHERRLLADLDEARKLLYPPADADAAAA